MSGSPPEADTADPRPADDPFQEVIDLSRAHWRARVLLTASDLRLFTALGDDALTADELAGRLGVDARGLELLAAALVAPGLLRRDDDGRFSNGPLARRHLVAGSPEYRGDVLAAASDMWEDWSRLSEIVRDGPDAVRTERRPDEIARFTCAMHQGKPRAGQRLVERLDLHGVRRVVDLGGGAGTFSEALAGTLPNAQVVLVDLPPVISAARQRLPEDLLEGRIVLVARDIIEEGIPLAGDPPGPYDLALLSSVLHLYGPEENATLLGRVYEVLEPGGQVAIREFALEPGGTEPAESALFSVAMLAVTRRGRSYTFDEMRGWLHDAGFGEVDRQPLDGPISLVTARRA